MSNNKIHEPLFHIVKRGALPMWLSWLIRILSVVAALIVCGVVTIVLTGENPIKIYTTMVEGAIGSERRIWSLFQNVAILLCISLAVTPAFKMKFWNIGAEGQVLMGGLATAACMIYFGESLHPVILFPVMIIASILASAIWAIIPAFFKAHWNTNETLFTLMMNYIAMQLVSYFVFLHSNPVGSGKIGIINSATEAGWLPKIGEKTYLFNIIIVAILTIGMYIYLKYNKHGYEISVVGESENTAKYIGINVKKVILRTMFLSGAICGIAGLLLVAGTDHSIAKETVDSRGFTAIMVSWLAKFNPIYMILTSLLIVFLEKGAGQISTDFGLNDSFAEILTGIIIFFIIGSEFFVNYTIKFRHKDKEVNK
ncbi:MAG: ABC transporter permease [Acutalibacteraceae bacterium]|nr:ABC transporter permease [Acutalibacteraceae bacterium]